MRNFFIAPFLSWQHMAEEAPFVEIDAKIALVRGRFGAGFGGQPSNTISQLELTLLGNPKGIKTAIVNGSPAIRPGDVVRLYVSRRFFNPPVATPFRLGLLDTASNEVVGDYFFTEYSGAYELLRK